MQNVSVEKVLHIAHLSSACTESVFLPIVFLMVKEEQDEKKPAEMKTKSKKKSKISENIAVELIINDILDPPADYLASSKKK